jgi:hypothetical protein
MAQFRQQSAVLTSRKALVSTALLTLLTLARNVHYGCTRIQHDGPVISFRDPQHLADTQFD